jgi:translation initiation factor eIF-2B subunit gamma
MAHEFQVVILAGGAGDRLSPLCESIPKPLLPVRNRPMLFYPLDFAHKGGSQSVIIATLAKWADAVRLAADQWKATAGADLHIDVVAGPAEGDTADAVRACADHLTKDFVVVGCDTLTSIPLRTILDRHRQWKRSTVTVVTKQTVPKDRKEGLFKNEAQQSEYTGYDERTGRLLYFSNSGDVTDTVRFGKHFLLARPRMTVTTTLYDLHIYIFQRWVVDFLLQKPAITSLKHELIPLLAHQQFRRRREDGTWGDLRYTIPTHSVGPPVDFDHLPERTPEFIADFNEDLQLMRGGESPGTSDLLRCFVVVFTPADLLDLRAYATRTNYLSTYFEVNKDLLRERGSEAKKPENLPPRVQIGDDCWIGPDFESGECVTIKGSVLGAACKLGSNVRISNSILMDGVIVEDQVKIANCIIASSLTSRTKIGADSTLKDCQLDAGYRMPRRSEVENEKLVREGGWDGSAQGDREGSVTSSDSGDDPADNDVAPDSD